MALSTRLIDCFDMKVGTNQLARPVSAEFRDVASKVTSKGDAYLGASSIDRVATDSQATIQAEDPLALAIILALTDPQAITAEGRLVNAATYQKDTLAHGVLVGFEANLVNEGAGTLRLDYRNRAALGSAALSTEHVMAAGSASTPVVRGGTFRFAAAGNGFTPNEGEEIVLPGLQSLRIAGRAQVIAGADTGSILFDIMDVVEWAITGQIAFRDIGINDSMSLASYLSQQIRGVLTARVQLTSQSDAVTPPTDQILTINQVQFDDDSVQLLSRREGTASIGFDAILRDAEGVALALADLIEIWGSLGN